MDNSGVSAQDLCRLEVWIQRVVSAGGPLFIRLTWKGRLEENPKALFSDRALRARLEQIFAAKPDRDRRIEKIQRDLAADPHETKFLIATNGMGMERVLDLWRGRGWEQAEWRWRTWICDTCGQPQRYEVAAFPDEDMQVHCLRCFGRQVIHPADLPATVN